MEPVGRAGRLPFAVLLGVVFVNLAGFGVVVPLLPWFAEAFDAPPWVIGVLFASYSLGNVFGEPVWGRLSDRWGRRPVLLLTVAGNALTYAALAFAPSIWAACLIRFCGGVLTGNVSTVQSYVADVTAPAERGRRLGLLGAAFGLGFLCGPGLGGLLASAEPGPEAFRAPLLAAAVLCGSAALGVFFFVRESRRHTHVTPMPGGTRERLARALAHPAIGPALAVAALSTGALAAVEATFGLWTMRRLAWTPQEIGLAFVAVAAAAGLAQALAVAPLCRRLGEAGAAIAGLVLTAAALLVFAGQRSAIGAVGSAALAAFGFGLVQPALSALVSHAADPRSRGELLGLLLSAGAAARVVGPLAAGALFGVSPEAPFVFAALLTAAAVLPAARAALRPPAGA